jgi:hypothetical protein
MGTFREVESFYAEGKEGFDGMKLEASRGLFILEGSTCAKGQDSTLMARGDGE